MKFEVKKGTVKREGVFYPKGSFFDAEEKEVQDLVRSGVVIPLSENALEPSKENTGPGDDHVPGKQSTKSETSDELAENTVLPELNADELIVDADHEKPKSKTKR